MQKSLEVEVEVVGTQELVTALSEQPPSFSVN